jgi:NADP-dependent aldehyde dehydrogenase
MITDNLIAGRPAGGHPELRVFNPATGQALPEVFAAASPALVDEAARAAHEAWTAFRLSSGPQRAQLLRAIAEEIENLGDALIQRAVLETGLPAGRITGERGRTCNQLRLFAELVAEGSWVEAVIDEALPDRQPLPRPDLRRMLLPLGPVAVFTASNFPLAFSTAGGDTAAALAAGCPVVVKAHGAHLGVNALVAEAISMAVERCQLPPGIFSSVQGPNTVGQALVQHPLIKAVGFTGSHRGGMALVQLAAERPEPIPVYAEMGSTNPVFLLPDRLNREPEALATLLADSVALGAGQFCTNPGLLVLVRSEGADRFLAALEEALSKAASAPMLTEGIHAAFEAGRQAFLAAEGVVGSSPAPAEGWQARPGCARVSAAAFLANPRLHEEVFGPFTLAICCDDEAQRMAVAHALGGQLTATLMADEAELPRFAPLAEQLRQKVGRLIFNGVPTGVEVSAAMHHGGPYPATSNSLFTSVGADAIRRFARPVCFQNVPEALLPDALKPGNPLGIWRTLNGQKGKL